ncbi:MAG TPA: NADH-quinone oxidoreductase subunit NuoH [Firmicutes bacterium]|nr:NADH-quinone oxidoreductase subunit NuoH [Bacillota bacterium]
MPGVWSLLVSAVVKVVLVLAFVFGNEIFLIWAERKVCGRIQRRKGPMYVGKPEGWLQSIPDVVKLLAKEDVIPKAADRWLFILAPMVVLAPAVGLFVVIPFGPGWISRDLNIGILYLVALGSFTMLSLFMAGWGSGNKWSTLGAMRAVAMLLGYEVPLALSLVGVAMVAGSLSTVDIVQAQHRLWFILLQPLGFVIFLVAAAAELNRTPFDLAEAEQELVAGYQVEYSGMRWAMFFVAEYANLVAISAIAATCFLGGWWGPFLPGPWWFLAKLYFFIFLFMWVRWTFPRIRIDHMMELGWKFLLPASLVNIVLTGVGVLLWG